MENYQKLISEIKKSIEVFNAFLKEEIHLTNIPDYLGNDPYYYLDVTNLKWGDYQFPRGCEKPGVYIYAGFDENEPNKIYAYIGKASYNSVIGKRLWHHFYNRLKQKIVNGTNYYFEGTCLIQFIAVIPIENSNSVFLASAIEEFLILELKNKNISLLNYIGN